MRRRVSPAFRRNNFGPFTEITGCLEVASGLKETRNTSSSQAHISQDPIIISSQDVVCLRICSHGSCNAFKQRERTVWKIVTLFVAQRLHLSRLQQHGNGPSEPQVLFTRGRAGPSHHKQGPSVSSHTVADSKPLFDHAVFPDFSGGFLERLVVVVGKPGWMGLAQGSKEHDKSRRSVAHLGELAVVVAAGNARRESRCVHSGDPAEGIDSGENVGHVGSRHVGRRLEEDRQNAGGPVDPVPQY